ncbi:MAG: hypothetical protein K2G56_04315 [Eubacterium sp.]|nr:hypothetical protein [Eubacterium sp.]
MATKKSKKEQENGFTKEQILASEKYADKRDILGAILCDSDVYTEEQISSLIDKFMKGKVN